MRGRPRGAARAAAQAHSRGLRAAPAQGPRSRARPTLWFRVQGSGFKAWGVPTFRSRARVDVSGRLLTRVSEGGLTPRRAAREHASAQTYTR